MPLSLHVNSMVMYVRIISIFIVWNLLGFTCTRSLKVSRSPYILTKLLVVDQYGVLLQNGMVFLPVHVTLKKTALLLLLLLIFYIQTSKYIYMFFWLFWGLYFYIYTRPNFSSINQRSSSVLVAFDGIISESKSKENNNFCQHKSSLTTYATIYIYI